jgi:hypothetical protein
MIVNVTNNTESVLIIGDLGNLAISSGATVDIGQQKSLTDIAESNDLITHISSSNVSINNGERDLSSAEAIKYITLHNVLSEHRDRSGKLRVHQTSRKFGTIIQWTGEGDDPDNPSVLGGGEKFSFDYKAGSSEPLVKYIDFNCVETETWLHEGYLTWKNAHMDRIDLMVVTRSTGIDMVGTGGNYDLYGGYLIVPAVPGEGSLNITSDITTHSGGLIYMPLGDLGEPPTAFWDADWNSSTQRYENITPAPTGNGSYNMFPAEIKIAHFVRGVPLLGDGFIALNSSDTDELGHGMRLKMSLDVNQETADDHDVAVACIMCLHRSKVA